MSGVYAHLGKQGGPPHGLVEHLGDVARRAGGFAAAAAPDLMTMAEVAGWLHDLGKFRPAFQQYLNGRWTGPEKQKRHSVYGAAAAADAGMLSVAFAVLGHHAGLHDLEGASELKGSLADPELKPGDAAPGLLASLQAARAGQAITPDPRDAGLLRHRDPKTRTLSVPLDLELRVRMLFSCLVDADYLDTERFFQGKERETVRFDARALTARLAGHVQSLSEGSDDSPVNAVRREVFGACLEAAAWDRGVFSLTAPTGSGKTLAAMAFALEHARLKGLRRVIVVLPFLAIIEQNAEVYRDVLNLPGDTDVVLEHHSAVARDDGDEGEDESGSRPRSGQAAENWDAPVVVTTAVQFLESLFSRRPSRCRKLHNIANAVVVFDEVQTLQFPLLDPVLSALRDLSKDYGVTTLLCSATRPTFAKSTQLPSGFAGGECREVIADRTTTFRALARARLELPFLTEGRWSWDDLADRLEKTPKALVIVNLRKHAQQLFDVLKRRGFANVHHLSSTMCPAHRGAVLGHKNRPEPGTVYADLRGGRCILVSTQVVEAGVDIDFPVVYRALSPLDAIIQAAGRADREGDATRASGSPAGRVIVFEPADDPIGPPGYYERATCRTRDFLIDYADDPSRVVVDPAVFEEYHDLLIRKGEGHALAKTIQSERRRLNFRTVDGLFKVIDEAGDSVVVRYGEAGHTLVEAIRRKAHVTAADRRRLQPVSVSLMPKWVENFRRLDLIEPLIPRLDDGPLLYTGVYDEAVGIRVGELPPEAYCLT